MTLSSHSGLQPSSSVNRQLQLWPNPLPFSSSPFIPPLPQFALCWPFSLTPLSPKKLDIDYVCAFPFPFKINITLQVRGTPWDPSQSHLSFWLPNQSGHTKAQQNNDLNVQFSLCCACSPTTNLFASTTFSRAVAIDHKIIFSQMLF